MIENSADRPKRSRKRKLLIAAILLVPAAFLASIVAHAFWAGVEQRGVSMRVSRIRGAGEPILPADFVPPIANPSDDGGPELLAAGDAVKKYYKKHVELDDLEAALPLRPVEQKLIRAAVSDLTTELADANGALKKPRQEWGLDMTQSPIVINVMQADIGGPRALANLLREAAILDHSNGDDAAALRRIENILRLARFADRHPSLVGRLVGIGCESLAADTIVGIAPDLQIGTTAGAASREAIRNLTAALLDDEQPREGIKRALQGERMMQLDAVESLMKGIAIQTSPGKPTRYNPLARYLMAPAFHRNANIMLDHTSALLALADEPDLPAVKSKLPAERERHILNLVADMLLPAIERVYDVHHRGATDRRLAALVLTIRAYQTDHEGRRPTKLDELVPDYLPAIPNDAMASGKQLEYRPDAPRPLVYSVGSNGVNDGGSDAWLKPQRHGDTKPERGDGWETLDRCVYLDRLPRPEPVKEPSDDLEPATQP
jgi:hypothetical protein